VNLVGRSDEVDSALVALGDPSCTIVTVSGPPGIGKTSLLDVVCGELALRGNCVHRVDGVGAAGGFPLSPFAHLLDPDDLSSSGVGEAVVRLVNRLAAAPGSAPPVLVVDDAHLLDDASLVVVHQLVRHRGLRAVIAVRSTERLPDDLAALLGRSDTVVTTLTPLDRDSIHELARRTLDGEVGDEVVEQAWRFSEGVPFYARELLLGALEAGTVELQARTWSARGPLAASMRFSDALAARVARLGGEGEFLVRVLAVGGPTAVEVLDTLVPPSARRAAERAGLTCRHRRVDGTELASFAHALYSETIRSWLDDAEINSMRRRLVEGLASSTAPDELLQRAGLLLELDLEDPRSLLLAADVALRRFDADRAILLARSADRQGAGRTAKMIEASALGLLGEHDAAERMLTELLGSAADDAARAEVVCALAVHLLMSAGEPDRARQVLLDASAQLPPPSDVLVRGQLATISFYLGDPHAALTAGRDWIDGPDLPPENAVPGLVSALSVTGRPDASLRLISAVLESPDVDAADWSTLHANLVWNRLLALWQVGGLRPLSSPVDGLDQLLRLPVAGSWVLEEAMLGTLLQLRGALDRASVICRGNVEHLLVAPMQIATFNLLLWASLEASRGDLAAARDAMALLERYPPGATAAFGWWERRTEAQLLAAEGRVADAIGVSLETAARHCDESFYRTTSLHDVVRFGQPSVVAEPLAQQARRPGATWWDRITSDHAAAAAGDDVGALIRVGRELDEGGNRLEALECFAHAMRRGEAATATTEDRVLAVACQRRIAELMSWCGTVRTPALLGCDRLLTEREAVVARLAAEGRSNAQIAEHLGTSVRTVGNQLQRAYDKLGVHRRSDLAPLVQEPAPAPTQRPSGTADLRPASGVSPLPGGRATRWWTRMHG